MVSTKTVVQFKCTCTHRFNRSTPASASAPTPPTCPGHWFHISQNPSSKWVIVSQVSKHFLANPPDWKFCFMRRPIRTALCKVSTNKLVTKPELLTSTISKQLQKVYGSVCKLNQDRNNLPFDRLHIVASSHSPNFWPLLARFSSIFLCSSGVLSSFFFFGPIVLKIDKIYCDLMVH